MNRSFVCSAVMTAVFFLSGCATPEQKKANFLDKGKKYVTAKQYGKAILEFRNAAKIAPRDPDIHYQLAQAYLSSGNPLQAVRELRLITDQLDKKHVGANMMLAEMMASSRDPKVLQQSEKLAEQAVATQPNNPDALSTLAFTELRLGKSDDAVEHLSEALAKAPRNLKSALLLARVRMTEHNNVAAEQILKKAAHQQPPSAEAFVALGEFYRAVNRPAEAEPQFQQALQIDPTSGAALLDLARVQLAAGKQKEAEASLLRASQLKDPAYRSAYGIYLFQSKRVDESIKEFERLTRVYPNDVSLRTQLISAHLASGRTKTAEDLLTAALKRNPKDLDALMQRGEIYLQNGRLREADSDINQVLRNRPDSDAAHYIASLLQRAQGRVYEQKQQLNEALRINPRMVRARIELAQLLIQNNDAKAAIQLLTPSESSSSQSQTLPADQKNLLPVVTQRNWAFIAAGDTNGLKQALGAIPANVVTPDLQLQRALLASSEGRSAEADSLLEAQLKTNPEDIRALGLLARSYVIQKKPDTALERVRYYVAQRPGSASLQLFLGNWLVQAGKRTEARAAYEAAKKASPGQIAPEMALAELDFGDGRYDAARQTAVQLLAAHPDLVRARLLIADTEQAEGKYKEAQEEYRKVLLTDPRNVAALNNIAYLLSRSPQMTDEALTYAQKATELAPNTPFVLDTIGWIYCQKGIYKTAVQYLERAVSQQPTALRQYHLAIACARAGEQDRGRRAYEAGIHMNPQLEEAQMAKVALETGPSSTKLAR